jgi:hypothetical protein
MFIADKEIEQIFNLDSILIRGKDKQTSWVANP